MRVIFMLLVALSFSHFFKLSALMVGVSLPSSAAFLLLFSLALIILFVTSVRLRVNLGMPLIINMLPWALYLMVPLIVGLVEGYELVYLGISLFNMSIVGFSVLLIVDVTIASRGRIYLFQLGGFFGLLGAGLIFVGISELVFSFVNPTGFNGWTNELLESGFISLPPYWKVDGLTLPRIFGYFQNPLTYGYLSLLIAVVSWAYRRWFLMVLSLLAMILSLTKALIMLAPIVFFLLVFVKRPSMIKLASLQILFCTFFVISIVYAKSVIDGLDLNREALQSVLTRIGSWTEFIEMIVGDIYRSTWGWAITQVSEGNPLGINDVDFAIDNIYLVLVLYCGWLGLGAFAIMYYYNLGSLLAKMKMVTGLEYRLRKAVLAMWFLIPVWGLINAIVGNISVFYLTYALVLIVVMSYSNRAVLHQQDAVQIEIK